MPFNITTAPLLPDSLHIDSVHRHGIQVVQLLQGRFHDYAETMLMMSHLGDPRHAFLLYFPLVFAISRGVGLRLLWVAAIGEWLNNVLKWFMYGQRPYWWVRETGVFDIVPPVQQYRLTCETGPGCPSGHAMNISSVLFVLIVSLLSDIKHKAGVRGGVLTLFGIRLVVWSMFAMFVGLVSVSRVFIATHFPHQVLMGTIAGIILGQIFMTIPVEKMRLPSYLAAGTVILGVSFLIFQTMEAFDMDPGWSVPLAIKHCADPSHVHINTTPFASLARDAGHIVGLGVGINSGLVPVRAGKRARVAGGSLQDVTVLIATVLFCQASQSIVVTHHPVWLFYCVTFAVNAGIIFAVVALIPYLIGRFNPLKIEGRGKLKMK